jgi:hypothetical protein
LGGEIKKFEELMEDWWCDEDIKFKQGQRLIPVQELKRPYKMITTMLLRLYEEDKSTHFQMEWFPMTNIVVNTEKVFNWADILAFNIF